jgi:hypothetical protein
MKKLFTILGIVMIAAFVFTSCKSNTASQAVINTDTIGLAAFRDWKIQQYQQAMYAQSEAQVAAAAPVKKSAPATRVVYRNARSSSNSGTMNTSSTHAAKQAPAKKGWSKAAKGAVIGGAGGAVLGAVINKRNRVVGGIVGGVLGGGIGYGVGRSQDKKDGRY